MRKSPLAVPRFEQTNRFECPQRITDRPSTYAESFGEVAFLWQRQTRRESAIQHQHSDSVGNLFGDASFFDRSDQERYIAGGIRKSLDSISAGW